MSNMSTGQQPALANTRMKKSAREVLREEIEQLQFAIEDKLKALEALDRADSRASGSEVHTFKYAGKRHWKAIRMYLEEEGELRTISQITAEMLKHGAMYGKRAFRAQQNVEVAVKMADDLSRTGDQVGLAEWFKKGGKYSHIKPDS